MLATKLLLLLASATPLVAGPFGMATVAQAPTARDEVTLEDRLNNGLRARLPHERAFVAKVSLLVEQNVLPLKLVLETFQYARPKQPYPFPYFQRAMILRARQVGVDL